MSAAGAGGRLGFEFAPAKINLALHVTARRADGYHELDSLVVFADVGDTIEAFSGTGEPSLELEGRFAEGLGTDADNLVLRAARALNATDIRFRLNKRLPVASGIGGGSADAAATLRLVNRCRQEAFSQAALLAIAEKLGADVPMCLHSAPLRARGIGEAITSIASLPSLCLVLVNPGIGVSTPAVFRRLQQRQNPPLPEILPEIPDVAAFAKWLATTRNDLQTPAIAEAPAIGAALDAISAMEGCLLARMSGSGATVFGIYADSAAARRAALALESAHPAWWTVEARTLAAPPQATAASGEPSSCETTD